MEKKIEVPFLQELQKDSPMQLIAAILDSLERHGIDQIPWPDFNYKPEASFSMGHGGDCIFLKYYVTEAVIKASSFKPNDPVYKDSCVEFFISFGDEKEYYNLEFNVIGTCLFNYGIRRDDRKLVGEEYISLIRYTIAIENQVDGHTKNAIHWEITLMIPVTTFSKHQLRSLSGMQCRANFYKCGDDLPVSHFLAWSNIQSSQPDFHRPEYFGKVIFC